MIKRVSTAIGLALAIAAPAYALDEPLPVSNVKVETALQGVETADAIAIYPNINTDLETAIWGELKNPQTAGGEGYDINVRLTSLSLDAQPVGPDGKFNTLEGAVTYTQPHASAPVKTVPITIRATSADVPMGVIAISPDTADYYTAMLAAFANGVGQQMDGLPAIEPGADNTKN